MHVSVCVCLKLDIVLVGSFCMLLICDPVGVCVCVEGCLLVYMCVCVFFPLLETAGLLTDDRFGVDVWCASNVILWLYIIFDALCIYIIVCWRLYIYIIVCWR